MNVETFFEKFEQFADAPNGVSKMRDLVLELAIQGKLVPQFSGDEPASNQLERIAAKKAQTGRVSRAKTGARPSAVPKDAETRVPNGWQKTALADLVTVLNGRAYSKDELIGSGTPVLRVGNLFTSKHWYYSDLGLEPDKYCDKGDLIFAWSASFGPFIWPGPRVIYHYHIWKLELHSETDLHKDYLYWFLQNKTQEIKRAGHGVSMLHMTKEKMEKLEVMLPPLAEQKRIVAKVYELMALCDQLETQQIEREQKHATLARASLAQFAAAPTPSSLEFIFHKSYDITPADLRKAIRSLAVRGKLVPQDHRDEPASELLQKIVVDQKRLVAVGQIRRNEIAPLAEGEQPFGIPSSWAWTRLGQVGDWGSGSTPPRGNHELYGGSVTWLKSGELNDNRALAGSEETVTDLALKTCSFRQNKSGDVLLAMYGATIGKAAILAEPAVTNQAVCGCTPFPGVLNTYLFEYLVSQRDAFHAASEGGAQPNISKVKIVGHPFPIPPIEEQGRIVAKVEQLMALVDALETQLAEFRATGANLLSALVAELSGAPNDGNAVAVSSSGIGRRGRPKKHE
jgi:type I restriction enzyme S subunit